MGEAECTGLPATQPNKKELCALFILVLKCAVPIAVCKLQCSFRKQCYSAIHINCTFETAQCILFIVQCAVCIVQCKLHKHAVQNVHFTVCIVQSKLHSIKCVICLAQRSLCNVHCTWCNVLYRVHCPMYIAHDLMCNRQWQRGWGLGAGRVRFWDWRKKAWGNEIIASTRLFQN